MFNSISRRKFGYVQIGFRKMSASFCFAEFKRNLNRLKVYLFAQLFIAVTVLSPHLLHIHLPARFLSKRSALLHSFPGMRYRRKIGDLQIKFFFFRKVIKKRGKTEGLINFSMQKEKARYESGDLFLSREQGCWMFNREEGRER